MLLQKNLKKVRNTVTDCLKRTLYWGHIPKDERIRWMSVRMSLPLM